MQFKATELTVEMAAVALPEKSRAWAQHTRVKLARSPKAPSRVQARINSSSSAKMAAASVVAVTAPVLDPAPTKAECLEDWYLLPPL